jgi:ABC-type nitrate/sulfonate/bicarbonate transport system substrate-binding protein
MKSSWMAFFRAALAIAGLTTCSSAEAQTPATLPTLTITVFAPPSQSIWIPTLIQELGLDRKHGFVLKVVPKPSSVAYADFASGADPVCYCASIPAVARFKQQGADITLLWNIFNFESYIVTNNPELRKPRDFEGHTIQADTITGNWILSSVFLEAHGVSLSKLRVQSMAAGSASSLVELQLKRIDGIVLNPTEASAAIVRSPEPLTAVPLFDAALWRKKAGADALPTIAIGVWRTWFAKPENQDLARRFYGANLEAQAFIHANPKEAAAKIAGPSKIDEPVLVDTFERFQHLINIRPLKEYRPTVALLTQKLLPESKQLPQPFSDAELDSFVADFTP